MTRFVALGDIWPTHGLASVLVACLEDAGFHPVIECDPRGWLQFRGWPLGSQRPVTVWLPQEEFDTARMFLDAPFELETPATHEPHISLWAAIAKHRRLVCLAWLAMMFLFGT